jgi:serine/threonine protein kinase
VIRKDRVANETAVRWFLREVKAAASLDHPNVVHAYDADQIGDTHVLVMEYIDGSDLSKLVKQKGPLPIDTACEYIRQAALGLQHAHEKGLIHRDIKPSNIVVAPPRSPPSQGGAPPLTKGGPGGVVKLLDLRLAHIDHLTAEQSSSTLT